MNNCVNCNKEIEPVLIGCSVAQLPVLPEPLSLKHGPLLISVEKWSDGSVIARLPATRLHAYGDTEASALAALAEDIAEAVVDLTTGPNGTVRLGGAMLDTWRALCALIEGPGLDG